MAKGIPHGKGSFWWYTFRKSVDENMALFRQLRMDHVTFKGADAQTLYPPTEWQRRQLIDFIAAIRQEFPKVKVGIYGYSYLGKGFTSPKAEAIKEAVCHAEAAKYYGADFYILDAEGEWRSQDPYGKNGLAKEFVDTIVPRLKAEGIPFGLSTYRFPQKYQPDFPMDALKGKIDFNMPQVYYLMDSKNHLRQLDQSAAEYEALFPGLPLIPAGPAFPYATWKPSPQQIAEFAIACKDLGFEGTSLWDVVALEKLGAAHLEAFSAVPQWQPPEILDPIDRVELLARLERMAEAAQESHDNLMDSIQALHDLIEGVI